MKISCFKFFAVFFCFVSIVYCKTIDTLAIEGLFIQQRPVIENTIGLRKGAEFSSSDIQSAIKKLSRLGLFRTVDMYVTAETDSAVSLLCKVTEYPMIEAIDFSGNKKFKRKELEEKMTLKKGQILSDALVFDNVNIFKKLYEQKGYLLIDITSELLQTRIPGNVAVKFKISENEKVMIKSVSFKGNVDIKESKLKSKFKTKEKKWLWGGDFDKELYKSHLDSLIIYYNELGYVDAHIVHDSIWYGESKKDLYIQIEVSEGKKFYTGNFFFNGNKVIETSQLEHTVALKKGAPFQKSKFEATKELVSNAYREEGFLWVQVKDNQAYRGDTIDITFDINESKPAIVRKIDINGNTKTMEKVIRREMTIYPGQKYKQSLMMRSVRDIYQLNYFGNVKPDLSPNDDGTVDLDFGITEKDNIGQFSLGAAYSQTDNFTGTMSISIPNFRGAGEKLDLSFQLGKTNQLVSLNFTEPWAFNTPTSLSGGISYTHYDYSSYKTTEYGFTGGVSRRLKWPDDYFSASAYYDLKWKEDYDSTKIKFSNNLHIVPKGLLSRLRLVLRRDDTDMPTFPNEGSSVEINPEIAGLGGNYQYIKTITSCDWYYPIIWKFVLGTHSKFGIINKLPWSDDIKISRWDALGAGGVYGVDGQIRGYAERSFGSIYNPENGKAMLTLSAELRYPLLEQTLYLSTFADMGNTWASLEQVNMMDLYPGVGVGVRLLVPMLGLMGFDFGYGLRDPKKDNRFSVNPRPQIEFHFQMGKGY
ncbi:MAG TPA: outer membrane protein assembly factor BamA [Fibrobacteres bacterium]|nr:outer membrane protein assembly factor BamA [Fibrobacterota bacterium]